MRPIECSNIDQSWLISLVKMLNSVDPGFLFLVVLIVVSYGQEIYPDSIESSAEESFGVFEDNILQNGEPAGSFWQAPKKNEQLSPAFTDKSLSGNCTGTSAIACTGCRRVRVCIPGIRDPSMLPEINCPPSTYCHTLAFDMGGACLATIDPQFPECRGTADNSNSGQGTGSDLCTGLGVFPDPSDCHRFNLCTSIGGFARKYKCPSNYVYNSQKKSCSKSSRCRKIQCHPNVGSSFVGYPQDPKYYAYCNYERSGSQRVLKSIVMYRCSAGSEFNDLANGCVFKCPREGFFRKPGYPSRFYWCRKVRGNLFGYEQACPWPGSSFNHKLGICIPPPLTTTMAPITPITTAPTVATDSSSTSATTQPAPTTTPLADSPLVLPPWPQFSSLPVSSLIQ
ncbi:uncharacterized protein LOC131292846 [Anopheles ziemanni]|uniref:uncharacterized protein LOC131271195 n=1 Tax=Anopheles coustani TaxID=139045 RepID=UPI002659A2B5|nr:uncharacterized protein LOC131271195 [Anopheles coustani]XP_058176923.1 uncharacterized protein LOC131292846 [Anopheles ziemanni]